MKKYWKPILMGLILTAGILSAAVRFGAFNKFLKPSEEELLAKVPIIDTTLYNRLLFDLEIRAGNNEGESKDFTDSGTIELKDNISHLYNMDIFFAESGYKANPESWTDFSSKELYVNYGKGWKQEEQENKNAIKRVSEILNERDLDQKAEIAPDSCTLSWRFDSDVHYLFSKIIQNYTDDMELSGEGRVTAVFNPDTYEFEYFTVVISGHNKENIWAVFDAVFQWEAVNDENSALSIPDAVRSEGYKNATGISTKGYDKVLNPMAENLMESYGGKSEIICADNANSLFWTGETENGSAAISYIKGSGTDSLYEENSRFMESFYGAPTKETDDCSYFYVEGSGELAYLAKGDGWHAQITVTGKPGDSQTDLIKSLIKYKAKLAV